MVRQSPITLVTGTLALCILVAAGGLLVTKPVWSVHLDIGNEGPFIAEGETRTFYNLVDFYPHEAWAGRSVRWSEEQSAVTIASALRAQPLLIDITMCGCRKDHASVPVNLLLNDAPSITLPATDAWRRYTVLLPPDTHHPDDSVMIDLHAPAWNDGERMLGVAVDHISLRQMVPQPYAEPVSVLVVLVCIVGMAWWWCSLLPPLLLAGCCLVVGLAYQPQLLPLPVLLLVLAPGLVGLWWSGSKTDGTNGETAIRPTLVPLLAVWFTLSPQLLGGWIIDDAFISFRYARNLLDGSGLVFNIGERVEGYTNFLWTLIIAGEMASGYDPIVTTAAITMLLAFVIAALTLALARQVVPGVWVWGAPVLLALSSPFLLYTSRGSGMETALFTALFLAALLALLHRRWIGAGVLVALTMLTRPDGAVLACAGGLYALWIGWREGEMFPARLRPAAIYSICVLVFYAPYFGWRWSYYGYLLPNTFYVKVGSTWSQVWRGFTYTWLFANDYLLLWVALVGLAAVAWLWWRRQVTLPPEAVLLPVVLLLFISYVVVVGGDWMPGARFFVPVIPLLAVVGVWGMALLAQRGAMWRWGVALVAAGLLGVLAATLPRDSSYRADSLVWNEARVVRRYREVGRWIAAHTPPDTVVVALAGAMSYYADRTAIDVLGLTDAHIAHLPSTTMGTGKPGHEKGDAAYVLGRAPRIIPWFAVPYLDHEPAFAAEYHLEEVRGPEGNILRLFVRNERKIPGQ